jgi:hypothetical protein
MNMSANTGLSGEYMAMPSTWQYSLSLKMKYVLTIALSNNNFGLDLFLAKF